MVNLCNAVIKKCIPQMLVATIISSVDYMCWTLDWLKPDGRGHWASHGPFTALDVLREEL